MSIISTETGWKTFVLEAQWQWPSKLNFSNTIRWFYLSFLSFWILSSIDSLGVAPNDVTDVEGDNDVWLTAIDADASLDVAADDEGLNEAALALRDDELGVELKDFEPETDFEPDSAAGPRTGALGGRGGGESEKANEDSF